jgi:transcriptional regulator with XRE-family HTH domain
MFGKHVRKLRQELRRNDTRYSLRQVARRLGVEPAYLSKVERGLVGPPSEAKIVLLAAELGEDADVLLALAGKVSSDVLAIIRRRPRALAGLVRSMRNISARRIASMARAENEGKSPHDRKGERGDD